MRGTLDHADRSSPSGGGGTNTPQTGGTLSLFSNPPEKPASFSEKDEENGYDKKKSRKDRRSRSRKKDNKVRMLRKTDPNG